MLSGFTELLLHFLSIFSAFSQLLFSFQSVFGQFLFKFCSVLLNFCSVFSRWSRVTILSAFSYKRLHLIENFIENFEWWFSLSGNKRCKSMYILRGEIRDFQRAVSIWCLPWERAQKIASFCFSFQENYKIFCTSKFIQILFTWGLFLKDSLEILSADSLQNA